MKTICLSLILLIASLGGQSQAFFGENDTLDFESYEEAIQTMFGGLDTTFFPGGILLNVAPISPGMLTANGKNLDSVFVLADLLFTYSNIHASSAQKYCNKHYFNYWHEQLLWHEESGEIPINVAHFNAHYLDDSAYVKNEVAFNNGRLADVPGRSRNPYYGVKMFLATPLLHNLSNARNTFVFYDSLYLTNDTAKVMAIEVDFDDGLGFRAVDWNVPFDIIYGTTGTYYPVFRFIFNNDTLATRTMFLVDIDSQSNQRAGLVCNENAEPYDIGPFDFDVQKDGQIIKGEYAVWLGCGNQNIRKPFIILGGFNPLTGKSLDPCLVDVSVDWITWSPAPQYIDEFPVFPIIDVNWNGGWRGTLYEGFDGEYIADFSPNEPKGTPNGTKFLAKLREEGYDIVIAVNKKGTDRVKNNAAVLKHVIKEINQQLLTNGSKHEIVVAGYSLGAVSSRYALAEMEIEFEQYKGTSLASQYPHHRCKLWVSVEGEMQGANVNLAFQKHLQFWAFKSLPVSIPDLLNSLLSGIALLAIIDSDGSKELNIAHYASSEAPIMKWHPLRDQLNADFNAMWQPNTPAILRGYPIQCRRVGASQGSGVGNSIYNLGNPAYPIPVIDIFAESSVLPGLISIVVGAATGNPLPIKLASHFRESTGYFTTANQVNTINYVNHGMRVLFGLGQISFVKAANRNKIYNYKIYNDFAPGAYQSFSKTIGKYTGWTYHPITKVLFGTYFDRFEVWEQNMQFTPTVSCLDLHSNLPGVFAPLSYGLYPDAGLYTNASSYGIFRLNPNPDLSEGEHPNKTWGFPHILYPSNKYKVTPFDAVWAVGDNYNAFIERRNHFHVEDPQLDLGYYLANVEVAPERLFLSNRTIHNQGITQTYRAAFEARYEVVSGFDIYGDNLINPDAFDPSEAPKAHHLTENGNFILASNTDVDIRAGQIINFKPGFQVHNGAKLHAFIQPFSNGCPNILRHSHPQQQPPLAQQAPEPEKTIVWNEKNSDNQGLKIYPNPSTGDVLLEITGFEENGYYMLYDLTGRMLQTGLITGSQTSITMQHKGVLIVEVTQGTLVQRQRLIVH